MKIKSYIKSGNSFPIICENNGQNYFVKLRAGMSGSHALISEWVGNQLGQQLNLNTQTPIWIELTDAIEFDDIYIEVRELVQKSLGLNIGFRYLADATEIGLDEIKMLDKSVISSFFLLDLVMLNVDRTINNTNLMKVGHDIFTIDFESSLLFQDVIAPKNLVNNDTILSCFRSNPLYSNLDESTIHLFISKLEKVNFEKIIADIPSSILNKESRIKFLKGIENRQSNNWFLKQIMKRLHHTTIDTPEEQKKRRKKNQEELRKKMK